MRRLSRPRRYFEPSNCNSFLDITCLDEDEDEEADAAGVDAKVNVSVDACDCVFHRSFAGLLRSDVACAACGEMTSTILEATVGISIDVPSGTASSELTECLRAFTAAESIESRGCATRGCATTRLTKRVLFERLPRTLTFHLKRFEGVGFEILTFCCTPVSRAPHPVVATIHSAVYRHHHRSPGRHPSLPDRSSL